MRNVGGLHGCRNTPAAMRLKVRLQWLRCFWDSIDRAGSRSDDHVSVLGTSSIDLPQQAGIPCIAAALAAAIEQQVGIQRSTRKCSDTRWSETAQLLTKSASGQSKRTRGSSAASGSTCLAQPHTPPPAISGARGSRARRNRLVVRGRRHKHQCRLWFEHSRQSGASQRWGPKHNPG